MTWTGLDWRWYAGAALGGTVVLALGTLAAAACRQPARRARVVVLTVLGGLLVPWVAALPIAPRWSAGLIPALAVERRVDRPLVRLVSDRTDSPVRSQPAWIPTGVVRPGAMPSDHPAPAGPTALARPARVPAVPWAELILMAYGTATVGLAGWWLAGQVMLMRVVVAARPAPGHVRDRFLVVSGPPGARVRLLQSDRVALPFTFTWGRPTILLPSELCGVAESDEQLYALGHEWSHVERRDYRSWTMVSLAGLLLFPQPLFWWLRRQLRLCQDYLADDRAAALGTPEAYAAYLVRLARRRAAGPSLPALGIGGRRSNLYRRVLMLVQDREPWERRCRTLWAASAAAVAALVIVAASGLRLDAASSAGSTLPDPPPEGPKETPAVTKTESKGELLDYSGTVKDKESGEPIAGATVTVRRSVLSPGDNENRLLQETKHLTDAAGRYRFTIPPEQSVEKSLYIELDVEAPGHASQTGFGYALGMIRKNEATGGRPFFETIEMYPGAPVTGRVQTPEGAPARGVKILAFSRTDKVKFGDPSFTMGSFTRATTDDSGAFRVQLATPGLAVFWILPSGLAMETHPVPDGKRGDLGSFALKKGVVVTGRVLDARGKPVAGVYVNAERDGRQADEILGQLMVSDAIARTAVTDADGGFTLAPLPVGTYKIQPGPDAREQDGQTHTHKRRPLADVFLAQKLTTVEGEAPESVVIRAAPHVTIEAQWVDSKGNPTWGFESTIFGRIDNDYWMGQARILPVGKVAVKVPHGLEDVQFGLMTNEHHAIKYRTTPGGPLMSGRQIMLGTLDHDVKGIEIVHYNAPIVTVKGQTRDGKPVPGLRVTATYAEPDGGQSMKMILPGGVQSDVNFEAQEDGRHRSSQLSPDREAFVTAQADGFKPATAKLNLPEGKSEDLVLTLDPK